MQIFENTSLNFKLILMAIYWKDNVWIESLCSKYILDLKCVNTHKSINHLSTRLQNNGRLCWLNSVINALITAIHTVAINSEMFIVCGGIWVHRINRTSIQFRLTVFIGHIHDITMLHMLSLYWLCLCSIPIYFIDGWIYYDSNRIDI